MCNTYDYSFGENKNKQVCRVNTIIPLPYYFILCLTYTYMQYRTHLLHVVSLGMFN